MFELRTEKFSGPIEKLLELIDSKKMEITELNLASITADFLAYLETIKIASANQPLKKPLPRMLADFLVVATQLLLIKSKALLPNLTLTEEEEESIHELEARLLFYQRFKPAIANLKKLSEAKNFSYSRPLFMGRPAFFLPSENISQDNFKKYLEALVDSIKRNTPEEAAVEKTLISLEEKIGEIIDRFNEAIKSQNFKELIHNKSRSEIVVAFLAILHLIERQIVSVEQNEEFSDIIINKN